MAFRTVTIEFDVTGYEAGSLYELWLRPAGGSWGLFQTGAVENAAVQSFTLDQLDAATEYDAQIRQVLAGRYRAEYAAFSPSDWPAGSLLNFTTGGP